MISVAVVGAGRIAQHHLACLAELPGVQTVAVCDRSAALAGIAAERFGIPRAFQDFGELLDSAKPDVVHVTTPPRSHFSLAMQALERGSHVFVEKPIATSSEQLNQLVDEAEKRRLYVIENLSTLFHPEVLRLQKVLDQGTIGEVIHAEVFLCRHFPDTDPYVDPNAVHDTMALPLGPISDWLPHLATLVIKFIGKHDRIVGASLTKSSPSSRLPFDEFRAYVEAEGRTGAIAFSANIQPDTYTIRVEGTKARATVNMFEAALALERRWPFPKPLNPVVNNLVQGYQLNRSSLVSIARKLGGSRTAHPGIWGHIASTYEALRAGQRPPVSVEQIVATHRLVADIEQHVGVR
jgi:predicted dehydrogenase